MRNIIFIAPPAAGKGTVSKYLEENYNYIHISTGDLLREEINNQGVHSREINEIISNGNLVSDELIFELVEEKIINLDYGKPFILDGFPRTLNQATKLEEILVRLGINNNLVVYLQIDVEEATKRILSRVICPKCKRSYSLINEGLKPKIINICDNCKIELEKRNDDNEETFKVRFESYLKNTRPILDYYQEKGLLISVDGTSGLSNMLEEIIKEAKK